MVRSYGFRGEALSSLCALSTSEGSTLSGVNIITRTKDSKCGWSLTFKQDGTLVSKQKARRDIGTTIKVTGLYKPLPVRRKEFIKTLSSHFRKSLSVLEAFGICTEVELQVLNFSKSKRNLIFKSSLAAEVSTRIANIFGHNFLGLLEKLTLSVETDKGLVELELWLTNPKHATQRNTQTVVNQQLVFVNNRIVTFKKFDKVIKYLWKENCHKGRYSFILFVTIPSEGVDVNVSPDKQTIFIDNNEKLFSAFQQKLEVFLENTEKVFISESVMPIGQKQLSLKRKVTTIESNVAPTEPEVVSKPSNIIISEGIVPIEKFNINSPTRKKMRYEVSPIDVDTETVIQQFQKRCLLEQSLYQGSKKKASQAVFSNLQFVADSKISKFHRKDFTRFNLVGQFNLGFIIARVNQNLFIFDQHASDEIKRFETLIDTVNVTSQTLIQPLKLDVSPFQISLASDNKVLINKVGFKFDVKEGQLFLLAVPVVLKSKLSENDFYALLEDLSDISEGVHSFSQTTPPEDMDKFDVAKLPKLRAQFAMRACRGAIMVGTALKKQKQTEIIENLSKLRKPFNCPHGRPTMRHLSNLAEIYSKRSKAIDENDELDSDRCFYFDKFV